LAILHVRAFGEGAQIAANALMALIRGGFGDTVEQPAGHAND
jgi:hypothetical protein